MKSPKDGTPLVIQLSLLLISTMQAKGLPMRDERVGSKKWQ